MVNGRSFDDLDSINDGDGFVYNRQNKTRENVLRDF